MTTVSVVECISPVSLRTCGSSTSSLHNRKRLQTKCISPSKRTFPQRQTSRDVRDQGLEASLTSSPISSPIPRSTISLCGGRESSSPLLSKSKSTTPVLLNDSDYPDKLISKAQSVVIPDLCVVGSKPKLHGMWEVEDNRQATPIACQLLNGQDDELFDPVEDRESSVSPNNPPPSPINFLPSLEGVVIGGQKLICPERIDQGQQSFSRDFIPGFVKQPQHHCVKCQGRIIEEELTQVTLNRRLSSIMDRHASRHHTPDIVKEDISKEHQSTHQIRSPDQEDMRSPSQLHALPSFSKIYAEKKRLKAEKGRLERKQRELRIEEKRIEDLSKLKEKIQRKEHRSKTRLEKYYADRYVTAKTKTVQVREDSQIAGRDKAIPSDLATPSSNTDLQLPPIITKGSTPSSASSTKTSSSKTKESELIQLPLSVLKLGTDAVKKVEILTDAQRSRSDTVWQSGDAAKTSAEKALTDTEAGKKRKPLSAKKTLSHVLATPLTLSPWEQVGQCKTPNTCFGSSTTLNSIKNVCESVSTEENSELQKIKSNTSNDNSIESDETKLDVTMTSTMIVPERDTPCSQWVSFNGDNEPVLNTSPEVDEGCDTFLKRLQRTKVINQNDPSLPSGQQFCFEAMVDKRYNRWKRRRRKKQSEARRASVVQNSDSSDENDERNTAMERIIDKMYEEIHGPVPQTPDGSRDTPRSRNRRRRRIEGNAPKVVEEDDDDELEEEGSYGSLYEASSEMTSDGAIPSSSSAEQITRDQNETTMTPLVSIHKTPQPSGSVSDDLCSWPYLERYKTEILKRLKSTSIDQLEDLDQNDWLPDIKTPENTPNGNGIQNKTSGQSVTHSKFYVGSPDNKEYLNNDPGNGNKESKYADEKNEDKEEGQADYVDVPNDSDSSSEVYKPFIRVERTPYQSPVQTVDNADEYYLTDYQSKPRNKADIYSYTRWSRSQRPAVRKTNSVEQKPKLLSRTNVTSWNDVRSEQQDFHEGTSTISAGDTNMETSDYNPIVAEVNVPTTKYRLSKKSQKVAMTIKKHNVNLPSLTKNAKSQTIPEFAGGKISRDKVTKGKQKTKFVDHRGAEERPRTQTPRNSTPTKGSMKESHTVPEFLFKDFYLRSLYGNKTRINSHVGPNKADKTLRKTLTVDNLDLVAKQPRKKKLDTSKAKELAFTRSFTFSMFDLPDMYKLYNTTLERRANGEQIETQE